MPSELVNDEGTARKRLKSWDDLCGMVPDGRRESVRDLLERCRQYLLLVANQELGGDLRRKAGASDLVQDTLLEAHKDLARFSGSPDELLIWLRRILLNRIANLRRRYQRTSKRNVEREQIVAQSSIDFLDRLFDPDASTPSGRAIRTEEIELLETALSRLNQTHRDVLTLRHREQLTFEQIGKRMNRTADAARMLWWRAFERLAAELEPYDVRP